MTTTTTSRTDTRKPDDPDPRDPTAKEGQASSDLDPPAAASAHHHLPLSGSRAQRPASASAAYASTCARCSHIIPGSEETGSKHSSTGRHGRRQKRASAPAQRPQPTAPHPGPAPARPCVQACRWTHRGGTGERTAARATAPQLLPRSGQTKNNKKLLPWPRADGRLSSSPREAALKLDDALTGLGVSAGAQKHDDTTSNSKTPHNRTAPSQQQPKRSQPPSRTEPNTKPKTPDTPPNHQREGRRGRGRTYTPTGQAGRRAPTSHKRGHRTCKACFWSAVAISRSTDLG